jgi:hypothetical protein
MVILNEPIDRFSFEKVVSFCQEGNIEGYQLEYKQDLSSQKGLSRQFASFSNSRGGVIVLGVVEDKIGKPVQYDGLIFDSKIIDRIHQYASNVEPRPLYDVHKTNEEKGKVFILVRVYEGDRPPYYVQNDPNLYIRTGSLTDPIGLAGPEATELLFHKMEKAELAQNNSIYRSTEVFNSALRQADKERLHWITTERNKHLQATQDAKMQGKIPPEEQKYPEKLGTQVSMLTLILQPYFPKNPLVSPRKLKEKIEEIRFTSTMGDFPDLNVKPIQDGLLHFKWNDDGSIHCHQLYSNGLLFFSEDVLRPGREKDTKVIYLSHIAAYLFIFLNAAHRFFSLLNYQGAVLGYIELNNVDGARLKRITPNAYKSGLFWDYEKEVPIMDGYKWNINIDTSLLQDKVALQKYFVELIREIYWSVGYEDVSEDLLKAFLSDQRWLV